MVVTTGVRQSLRWGANAVDGDQPDSNLLLMFVESMLQTSQLGNHLGKPILFSWLIRQYCPLPNGRQFDACRSRPQLSLPDTTACQFYIVMFYLFVCRICLRILCSKVGRAIAYLLFFLTFRWVDGSLEPPVLPTCNVWWTMLCRAVLVWIYIPACLNVINSLEHVELKEFACGRGKLYKNSFENRPKTFLRKQAGCEFFFPLAKKSKTLVSLCLVASIGFFRLMLVRDFWYRWSCEHLSMLPYCEWQTRWSWALEVFALMQPTWVWCCVFSSSCSIYFMLHHSCEGSQHKNVNNTYPFVKRQKKILQFVLTLQVVRAWVFMLRVDCRCVCL
jgi:hypothetical protein